MAENHKNKKIITQITIYALRDRESASNKFKRSQKLPRMNISGNLWVAITLHTSDLASMVPWSWRHIFSIQSVWLSRNWNSSLYATRFKSIVRSRYSVAYVRRWARWRALTSGALFVCIQFLKTIRQSERFPICLPTIDMASSFSWVVTWVKVCCRQLHTIQPKLRRSNSSKLVYPL